MRRKAQERASGAASLIIIIGILVVLYILFLPPKEREELLEGRTPNVPGEDNGGRIPSDFNEVLLLESPGRLENIQTGEIPHPLPSVSLQTVTSSKIIKEVSNIYVKNSVFGKQFKSLEFPINDFENTENVLLSFASSVHNGRLIILLNGKEIFNSYISDSPNPIPLAKDALQQNNVLEFLVSPTGFAFWKSNEMLLENVKITADVSDISGRVASSRFVLGESEKENLEAAEMVFYADCDQSKVGTLSIIINNERVFRGVPACKSMNNPIEISPETLFEGNNEVKFSTNKGNIIIDQIMVTSFLKESVYPSYFFELPDVFFEGAIDEFFEEGVCGVIDGYCPSGCDEDEDKDCCFINNNYWCDLETDNQDDRCVSYVSSENCGRCTSGYEEKNGDPPQACEGECGDDTDGECPDDCSIYYDKDCCFEEENGSYWWCDDFPTTGVRSICEAGISTSECDDCPAGYENSDGDNPDCPPRQRPQSVEFYDFVLSDAYDVILTLRFIDDLEMKQGEVFVNGHTFSFNTRQPEFYRSIGNYVEPGSNGITIVPLSKSLDIVELRVELVET
ncbi:hypothetical protein D6745_02570 [Candidatus Woesearchaeota archaeon]|nr:MAG: hypothetical protein D6745_02570 [Candidatus Woesearchaeota archaeon]